MRIISGKFKNQKITAPKGLETRPTSSRLRETLFNICQHYIEGARLLDLYAGSGAIGLEALSRGAAWVTFVDNDHEAANAIRTNIKQFNLSSQTSILCGDSLKMAQRLPDLEEPFQIIYLDPPYEKWDLALIEYIDHSTLLAPGGYLFVEEAKKPEISLKNLELISERKTGRSKLFQYKKDSHK